MNNIKMFETLSPTKLFLKCAFLGMLSMAVVSIYNIADGIFVGNFIGSNALAAVNLVMPILMIVFAFSNMIAVGSSVQIAIKLGKNDKLSADKIFTFCTLFLIALSVVFGIIGLIFADSLIILMGADAAVTELATQYVTVYCFFAPLILVFFAVDNYLRVCGKQRFSMLVNVLTAILNIFLDWLFIARLRLGISYAAIASCVSMGIGTIVCFIPFIAKKLSLGFRFKMISFKTFINIIVNGSSEFFTSIAGSIIMIIANTLLLRITGATGVAAFGIVMYIDSIVISIILGMTDAMQPAISYNYGAKRIDRVFALEKRVLIVGATIALSVMAALWLKGDFVVSLFMKNDNIELLDMTVRACKLYVSGYIFVWFNVVCNSFFTALNMSKLSLIAAIFQSLLFPIICISTLTAFLGLDGIWLSSLAANFLTAIIVIIFFTKTIGKLKQNFVKNKLTFPINTNGN